MNDINVLVLSGRVGSDPICKTIGDGETKVTVFRFASEEERGEYKHTNWMDAEVFGRDVSGWIEKGDMLVLTGRLRIRSWKDSNDQTRVAPEIRVDQIRRIPRTTGGGPDDAPAPMRKSTAPKGKLPF